MSILDKDRENIQRFDFKVKNLKETKSDIQGVYCIYNTLTKMSSSLFYAPNDTHAYKHSQIEITKSLIIERKKTGMSLNEIKDFTLLCLGQFDLVKLKWINNRSYQIPFEHECPVHLVEESILKEYEVMFTNIKNKLNIKENNNG